MSGVKVQRVKRSWKEFIKDPVFGKTVWETYSDGTKHYFRAEVYEYPLWPKFICDLVEIHEQGHLDGLSGQSYPLDIMFEAPGGLADTIWEKLMMLGVGPVVLARRGLTGSWFSKENRQKLEAVKG